MCKSIIDISIRVWWIPHNNTNSFRLSDMGSIDRTAATVLSLRSWAERSYTPAGNWDFLTVCKIISKPYYFVISVWVCVWDFQSSSSHNCTYFWQVWHKDRAQAALQRGGHCPWSLRVPVWLFGVHRRCEPFHWPLLPTQVSPWSLHYPPIISFCNYNYILLSY